MIFDTDDFGVNHIISDQCQTRDCRDVLLQLKEAQPNFKATLFAVPGEMSPELLLWSHANSNWIELAVHGLYHTSNYECEKMSYREFDEVMMHTTLTRTLGFYSKGFKAPGWQISDDIYKWLLDHDWWVADQSYTDDRRPKDLPVYKVGENSVHTHAWDCVGNGVYELLPELLEKVKTNDEWKFISEVI